SSHRCEPESPQADVRRQADEDRRDHEEPLHRDVVDQRRAVRRLPALGHDLPDGVQGRGDTPREQEGDPERGPNRRLRRTRVAGGKNGIPGWWSDLTCPYCRGKPGIPAMILPLTCSISMVCLSGAPRPLATRRAPDGGS